MRTSADVRHYEGLSRMIDVRRERTLTVSARVVGFDEQQAAINRQSPRSRLAANGTAEKTRPVCPLKIHGKFPSPTNAPRHISCDPPELNKTLSSDALIFLVDPTHDERGNEPGVVVARAARASLLPLLIAAACLFRSTPSMTQQHSRLGDIVQIAPAQEHLIKVQHPERVSLRWNCSLSGRVQADEKLMHVVVSPTAGQVTRVAVETGAMVRQGALLFDIESLDLAALENEWQVAWIPDTGG
jgi:hypothetical protein